MNTKTIGASGNAIRTLAEIQIHRLKWPSGRGSSADFYQEDTRWFLGVELKYISKSENSNLLKKLVKPPARGQAWMGYEGDEGERSTKLALYVYCDSTQGQQKVASSFAKN